MSFQPVIPAAGLAGWQFLQRTGQAQFAAFSGSASLTRERQYFLDRISQVGSAADLVADRRLLSVALGAFGLEDDLGNRAFIRKVLEDGTTGSGALANRLSDDRYRRLSAAFGFGPGEVPTTSDPLRMRAVVDRRDNAAFEIAVGEVDEDMRIALNAQGELQTLASGSGSDRTKWYTVMALPPLRQFFETAFGLPSGFGRLDIDKQLETLRDRTKAVTGASDLSQFADPDARQKLTNLFLARAQIAGSAAATSPASVALTLLQSARN
jgi:hypothetical protein